MTFPIKQLYKKNNIVQCILSELSGFGIISCFSNHKITNKTFFPKLATLKNSYRILASMKNISFSQDSSLHLLNVSMDISQCFYVTLPHDIPNLRQLEVTLAIPKVAFSLFLHNVDVIKHVSLMLMLMETGPGLCTSLLGHTGLLQMHPPVFSC